MPPVIPKTIFFFSKLMENTSVLFNAVTRCFIRDLALVDFFHGNGNYFRRIDVDEGFVAIGELAGRGVEFRVCQNTLTARKLDASKVAMEAKIVPSGVAEVARLQAREGFVYLRP